MDGKICQGVDKSAKVRGDGFTLTKNASALVSNLAFPPTPPDALLDHLLSSSVLQEVTGTSAGAEIYGWNFLAEQVHLSFVVAGGWVDCGGSFSLLNLVAG